VNIINKHVLAKTIKSNRLISNLYSDYTVLKWRLKGQPVPPPHRYKQKQLRYYAEKYQLKYLVETGSYYGDMIESMRTRFDKIFSIELSRDLYDHCKKRFSKYNNIFLYNGNSADVLNNIIYNINIPTLFWLDGHYSGGVTAKAEKETPIIEELACILKSGIKEYVILIDDARCFGNEKDYPSIEEIKNFGKYTNDNFIVKNDIIRIVSIE